MQAEIGVNPSDTVEYVQNYLAKVFWIPVNQQIFKLAGTTVLEQERTLASYGIDGSSQLEVFRDTSL